MYVLCLYVRACACTCAHKPYVYMREDVRDARLYVNTGIYISYICVRAHAFTVLGTAGARAGGCVSGRLLQYVAFDSVNVYINISIVVHRVPFR